MQGGGALKMIPLHRIQSVGFLEFAFLHFLPLQFCCWLALSRSNNMADVSIKTVELQWGSLRVTLEDAGSLQSRNQQVELSLTLARSLTLPVLLLQVLLCQNKKQNNMIKQHPQKILQVIQKGSRLIFQQLSLWRLLSNHVHTNLLYIMKTE